MTGQSQARRREVTYVAHIVPHYRAAFHNHVRTILDEASVDYRLICGTPTSAEALKGDLADLPWAEHVPSSLLFGNERLQWQPVHRHLRHTDLVILEQQNRLLANYPLQLLRGGSRRIALFGHGRNHQSRNPNGLAERWKHYWARQADWWFAYTEETRRSVEAMGFPSDRITVVNNAVDTRELIALAKGLSDQDIKEILAARGIAGSTVAIFVGGHYPDKRLDFLVAASDRIRERIPDFELIVAGGGEDLPLIQAFATTRPWLHVTGPLFGREKAALMQSAQLFLMPGLVGLAVVDAGALGLPVVTTDWPWHSPEIAYLHDGESGLIVAPWQDESAYAGVVGDLLLDSPRRQAMATEALRRSAGLTVENMAERFAAGILQAIS